MEPTLLAIGLNYRTAPVAVRERFRISESRRYEALAQLAQAEGIDEVVVLTTCNRTEFILWATDPGLAENSVLRFLTAEYGLTVCEWKHFYRLLDDAALLHIFRVASSLESMVLGAPQIVNQVKDAWQQAQQVGSTSPRRRTAESVDCFETGTKRDRNRQLDGLGSLRGRGACAEDAGYP